MLGPDTEMEYRLSSEHFTVFTSHNLFRPRFSMHDIEAAVCHDSMMAVVIFVVFSIHFRCDCWSWAGRGLHCACTTRWCTPAELDFSSVVVLTL